MDFDQAPKVKSSLKVKRNTKWVIQKNQLGTAHAVKQAVPLLRKGSIAVVLYGDVPLVSLKIVSIFFLKFDRLNSFFI